MSTFLYHVISTAVLQVLSLSGYISYPVSANYGKSTVQQLLLFLNHIYHSISDGCQHDVIYLDFHKALIVFHIIIYYVSFGHLVSQGNFGSGLEAI